MCSCVRASRSPCFTDGHSCFNPPPISSRLADRVRSHLPMMADSSVDESDLRPAPYTIKRYLRFVGIAATADPQCLASSHVASLLVLCLIALRDRWIFGGGGGVLGNWAEDGQKRKLTT
ncbi:hypothetical protein LZ31DRAFT_123285 [Colletotrichum somersetense]|nr:hypothetical protein LZ31DRAFT_123285 [Colletotrichum somersetense]